LMMMVLSVIMACVRLFTAVSRATFRCRIADSERNRPSFRFQIARHSEMKSPTIPR
jgi:hypothetical protein